MKVDFIQRIPGQHQIIGTDEMPAVPREGDTVVLGGDVYIVHSVRWVPEDKLAQVMLD